MIRIEKVTDKTFLPVVKMELPENQKGFVAANVMSLAQAWLYPEALPLAILNDEDVVALPCWTWRRRAFCGHLAVHDRLRTSA